MWVKGNNDTGNNSTDKNGTNEKLGKMAQVKNRHLKNFKPMNIY